MVELNFDKARPPRDPRPHRGAGARRRSSAPTARVRIGAGVPVHARDRRAGRRAARRSRRPRAPSARRRSATAARSAGTSGRASPAGDAHPPLLAAGADGRGRLDARDRGRIADRRLLPRPGPLRAGARRAGRRGHVPVAGGREQFAKIGTRNAMVIAVCSFALADRPRARAASARASAPPGRRRCAPPRRRSSSPACSTSASLARRPADRRRRARASASWSPPPRGRSTTTAAPPPTAGTRSACSPRAPSAGHAADLHGQRRAARGRPRLGGREPALRAARAARPARLQERVRAGRVRLLLRAARRRAGVRLPRAGGAGGGPRARHRRGPRAGRRRPATRCSRRSSTPARSSAGSARPG